MNDELTAALSSAADLRDVKLLAAQAFTGGHGVESRLAVAGRVCLFVCDGIEELARVDRPARTGAVRDSDLLRGCGGGETRYLASTPEAAGRCLLRLRLIASSVMDHMREIGQYDDFAAMVAELIDAEMFMRADDDIVIHRSLFAWHAVMETHMRFEHALTERATGHDGRGLSRYPKGDAKNAVVQSVLGPILGHHQLIAVACATFSRSTMNAYDAFVAYRNNMVWVHDWATAHRGDGDLADELFGALGYTSALDDRRGSIAVSTMNIWDERNYYGERFTAWLARLDHATREVGDGSRLHSGVLCNTSALVRKMTLTCVAYGSYGFWGLQRQLSSAEFVKAACACIGEMLRGWAIDHDTEASIGEHNLLNWLCVRCSRKASQEVLSPGNAVAVREDWEMRLAWAPQTYFYFDVRHHGLVRRVDNIRDRLPTSLPVENLEFVPRNCVPVESGDAVGVIVDKLLELCGIRLLCSVDVLPGLNVDDWACAPRICQECVFAGHRDQLFMLSVGCTRVAAMLPEPHRTRFISIIEEYGFRLFPAVQARLFVQCECVAAWTADVMSYGYAEADISCGQSACAVTATSSSFPASTHVMGESTGAREDDADRGFFLGTLLKQAHVEALRYAEKTGRAEWFAVVSRPIKALNTRS